MIKNTLSLYIATVTETEKLLIIIIVAKRIKICTKHRALIQYSKKAKV